MTSKDSLTSVASAGSKDGDISSPLVEQAVDPNENFVLWLRENKFDDSVTKTFSKWSFEAAQALTSKNIQELVPGNEGVRLYALLLSLSQPAPRRLSKPKLFFIPSPYFSSEFGDLFYTFDIISHRTKTLATASYYYYCCEAATAATFFVIIVQHGKRTWVVEKRYSDFDQLRTNIMGNNTDIPMLPPKTYFSPVGNYTYLDWRRDVLSTWLNDILKERSAFSRNAYIRLFLGFEE